MSERIDGLNSRFMQSARSAAASAIKHEYLGCEHVYNNRIDGPPNSAQMERLVELGTDYIDLVEDWLRDIARREVGLPDESVSLAAVPVYEGPTPHYEQPYND